MMAGETAGAGSSVAVIVVAAGEGTRLGYGMPKAYVPLAGRPLLLWALDGISEAQALVDVIVVAPTDLVPRTQAMVGALSPGIVVVAGGASRQESVARGLAAVRPGVRVVLVHDAARAQTPGELVDAVIAAVEAHVEGVIPGLPVTDTIKSVDGVSVVGTVDRSVLAAVQTPQGFPRAELDDAYARATEEHTDDAAVFAAAGRRVRVIPGDVRAAKITAPDDLARAEGRLSGAGIRTGVGLDVHAFEAAAGGRALRLAGLEWPGERALDGHSDGDAVAHAVCDALLSAAGLGDIGSSFGVDDPRYAGASGDVFVRGAVELLRSAGWTPSNVAVQIIGNRPRFSARREEAERVMTRMVGAPVSLSATTSDGLGFTGRGEGVTVVATALVRGAAAAPR
ncbi:MAG: 2-C-methyl-D-erythritol 4-phosphate cytidylyltransferase [Naasia sp.]